jgi:ADP-ribosylglycohydrolase
MDVGTAGVLRVTRLPALLPFPLYSGRVLGNGSQVLASDTMPFTLWCAARHLDGYEEALGTTVAAPGDRDTSCAIVGGIVALSAGRDQLPAGWLAAREPLGVNPK